MSLFAERRLLELRMSSAKPGTVGAKALSAYAGAPPEDNLLLILAPRIDKKALQSSWVRALDKAGVVVQVWPSVDQSDHGMSGGERLRLKKKTFEVTAASATDRAIPIRVELSAAQVVRRSATAEPLPGISAHLGWAPSQRG